MSGGVIDPDYEGEVCALVHNLNSTRVILGQGERIAQLVCLPYVQAKYVKVNRLPSTERGESGFGSTGRSEACTYPTRGKGLIC